MQILAAINGTLAGLGFLQEDLGLVVSPNSAKSGLVHAGRQVGEQCGVDSRDVGHYAPQHPMRQAMIHICSADCLRQDFSEATCRATNRVMSRLQRPTVLWLSEAYRLHLPWYLLHCRIRRDVGLLKPHATG